MFAVSVLTQASIVKAVPSILSEDPVPTLMKSFVPSQSCADPIFPATTAGVLPNAPLPPCPLLELVVLSLNSPATPLPVSSRCHTLR